MTPKFLLFVRSGSARPLCLRDYEPVGDVRLVISAYEPIAYELPDNCILVEGGRSKFDGAYEFFRQNKSYLNVEYAAFFDPDLDISWANILKLFQFGKTKELSIFQASLSRDSFGSWPHTFSRDKSVWRKTNFVEVMAPIISGSLLKRVWKKFPASISTWGLEYVWYEKSKFERAGIVDIISMKHVNPIRMDTGSFYLRLKNWNIDPIEEKMKLRDLCCEYGYKECAYPSFVPVFLFQSWTIIVSKIKKFLRFFRIRNINFIFVSIFVSYLFYYNKNVLF